MHPLKLVYMCGKGDWKWKREWLVEARNYNRSKKGLGGGGEICRRCLCGSSPDKPWIDMTERFNKREDLELAAQSSP